MNREAKLVELQRLKSEVVNLEFAITEEERSRSWHPKGYYTTYHLLAGMALGMLSAASSLLLNIIGASIMNLHPLQLIRVYLTFPLGEKAFSVDSGFLLGAGCCLYLGTGMLIGIPFHMILSRFFGQASFARRFVAATLLGVAIWLINYYGLLYWLQPMLIGGRWIIEQIPVFVAVLTHLAFGWTMLLIDPWGQFVPYAVPTGNPKH